MAGFSQTPVANRVKAVAANLNPRAIIVAKYTDNHRHCLYYIEGDRLFRHDVLRTQREEINFSNTSYHHVHANWLSPDGNFFFIVVEHEQQAKHKNKVQKYALWRYDSRRNSSRKIGSGYKVEHRKKHIAIMRLTNNPQVTKSLTAQQPTSQEQLFDLYGKRIMAGDDFEIIPQ